jgi:hypothetical protein
MFWINRFVVKTLVGIKVALRVDGGFSPDGGNKYLSG